MARTVGTIGAAAAVALLFGGLAWQFFSSSDRPVSSSVPRGSLEDLEWVEHLERGEVVRFELPDRDPASTTNNQKNVTGIPIHTVPEVREHERTRLTSHIQQLTDKLQDLQSTPGFGSPETAAEEGSLLYRAATAEACLQAVESGDFMVLRSTAGVPAAVENTKIILGSQVRVRDEWAWTCYVLPREKYPALFDARAYRDEVAKRLNQENARKFNALPYEERRAWIEADDIARKKAHEPDFASWMKTNMPRGWRPGGEVDRTTYTIRL